MIAIGISWIVAWAIVVLSILWLWTKTRHPYTNTNIPPFPVEPWPVVGHFLMLGSHLREKLKAWRKKTGGTYSLLLGKEHNIFVNDFEVIKHIMTKHADNIINVPESFISELLHEINKGIIFAKDDNWRDQRAASLSILRSLGMGTNIMALKIQNEVSFLVEKVTALEDQPTDLSPLIHACVSNIVFSISVGKRFQHTDPEFVGLVEAAMDMNKYIMPVVFLRPVKFLRHLPGDLFKIKKYTKAANHLTDFIKAYIAEIKQSPYEYDEPTNFIAAYITEMKKLKGKGVASRLNEGNLIPIIRTFFVAGTESTGATIMWCLLYVLYNPEVQEKIYREIDTNVGNARLPNMADKCKLTYLNAVILETERIASVVPFGLRRKISGTFNINGFTFPQGSVIWSVLDSVLQDTQIWGDPGNFRPERFIDANGALINREELIPFGIGRRTCLGEALARMELFLFLSALFQRFRFEPADGVLPVLEESFAAVCKPKAFQIKPVSRTN